MNHDSVLDPAASNAQSYKNKNGLINANAQLERLNDHISYFKNNDIKSESYDNAKEQLNGYSEILSALRAVNDADTYDFDTLLQGSLAK